ncbi:G-type lectin S-receptor-like serine/threonine-protein kinase At4g27290 isoform X2 [Curcuma longa]
MRRRVSSCKLSTFLLHLLLAGLSSLTIEAVNFLSPEQPLFDNGTTLISSGGRFELGFFSPAGSGRRYFGIWYRNISQTVVWVANRLRPIDGRSGRLSLSGEGTLSIASDNSTIILYSSTVNTLTNPEATLFDDGNFAVREAGNDDPNRFAWQSFDYPTDTLLPGMKLGWDLTAGLNRQLTSWASAVDPSPGSYTLGIDLQSDPQLFLRSVTQQVWRGGPWNGLHFSGAPTMDDPNLSNATFVMDSDQVIYSFNLLDPSTTISVLAVSNSAGVLQRRVWVGGSRMWDVTWYAPKDPCDVVSACGVNAVCDPNAQQMCKCLAGFLVHNSEGWNPGDSPYGCSRRSPLDCRNGTDGFFRIARTKLPDTSRSVVESRLSQDECRALCLSNCSCTAFASSDLAESQSRCIMWIGDITDIKLYNNNTGGGQDLDVRLGAFELIDGSSNQSSGRSYLAVMIAVPALAIFLLLCIAYYFCRRRSRKRKNCDVKEIEEEDLDLPLFDLDTVLAATSNFAAENKLGQGGFGPVYKGKLGDGQEIAVKRLSNTSTQGITEFKNEVVIIAKLQHQNLVRLLGCCIQGGERMLIYEYMLNGSLDAFLFDEAKRTLLDWKMRYNIIIGIARGLLYLHHDSRLKIIHRDLKTSNILLDEDNIPKISDFGLARIFKGDEMEINTRRVVGT